MITLHSRRLGTVLAHGNSFINRRIGQARARKELFVFSRPHKIERARQPTLGLRRPLSYPSQSAVEMKPFVGNGAKNRSVPFSYGLRFRVVPAQIHNIDVLSREVFQRFGEQRPRGHVRRRE